VQKFVIDFAPGLHGHFLEYVINRYIFKVSATVASIFQSSGACHSINTDTCYQSSKIIDRGHYSSFEYPYPLGTEKIVFIEHNPHLDFILLTNIYYRCHPDSINTTDFNVEEIKRLQESMMFLGSPPALKNNWYTKLTERHFDLTDIRPKTHLPVLYFNFQSFFALDTFLLEIKKTADFLDHTFAFDNSLVSLWKEFIQRNQGYNKWVNGNQLFENIVAGIGTPIDDDWKMHAYINYKISKTFALYDHPDLFLLGHYPSNTNQVHDIIVDHVKNFDIRW
jgi:hypothetical protein